MIQIMGGFEMDSNYSDIVNISKVEAEKTNLGDVRIICSTAYFSCGYVPIEYQACYYNYMIATAFTLIGELYCPRKKDTRTKLSSYHRGIDYLAKKVGTTKAQIKALRKQFKVHNGYVFRTPYVLPEIIKEMIDLLKNKKTDPLLLEYLQEHQNKLYRDILIQEQFKAIEISAANATNSDDKVKKVYNKLYPMIETVKFEEKRL